METDSGGMQNEFFNRARQERALLTVLFTNGNRLTGRVRAFDRFTILLETQNGDEMVYKHAIATVGPARKDAADDAAR